MYRHNVCTSAYIQESSTACVWRWMGFPLCIHYHFLACVWVSIHAYTHTHTHKHSFSGGGGFGIPLIRESKYFPSSQTGIQDVVVLVMLPALGPLKG